MYVACTKQLALCYNCSYSHTCGSSCHSISTAIPAARLMTNMDDEEEEEEGEGEGEEGGGRETVTYETEFEVRKFIQRFVSQPQFISLSPSSFSYPSPLSFSLPIICI